MMLSDGRRVLSQDRAHLYSQKSENIIIHPEFRLIVLANRPGYPFLGNDFFRECGDLFSIHAIDNPDVDSEIELLKQYAPNVHENLLYKLSYVFKRLRDLYADVLDYFIIY